MIHRGVNIPDGALLPPPTGWPAPAGVPVLLFGGSFDPPHLAHFQLALHARDAVLGDEAWLVLVPVARSPHKAESPGAGPADRVRMLEMVAAYDGRTAVWTDEIDRSADGTPSYWWQTLCRAASLLDDGTPMRFLMGADQALAFDRWAEPEMIEKLAEPAVLLRAPLDLSDAFESAMQDRDGRGPLWRGRLASKVVIDASSTDVRKLIAEGDWGGAGELVGPEVLSYIRRRRLYR